MKITVKVQPDQIIAVVAQAWGCAVADVNHEDVRQLDGLTLETDLKGATKAEKIIDKATKAVEG